MTDDVTRYAYAEFVGGPRDGETALVIGPPNEICVPLPRPAELRPLDGIASPLRLRVGRYVLEGPHTRVTITDALARDLGDNLRDFVVRESEGKPASYVWHGE